MSTIKSVYLQHLNGSTPNATMDTNGNFTVGGTVSGASSNMFRNRIINGDMRIDQRNAGASVTPTTSTYLIDRWTAGLAGASSKFSMQQNAGSVTPPTGFTNYFGVTSLSAYSVAAGDIQNIQQHIEGTNVADLAWGTANAQTVTLSFRVRSSLTGTFGGALRNSANDRSYPFSYTISSANTWEYKTITIPGDTTGTWLTTTGVGIRVTFSIGTGSTYAGTAGSWAAADYRTATGAVSVVGTNGATFYITGVQLEVGTAATPFEFRQYGTELALCYRYYRKYGPRDPSYLSIGAGIAQTSTVIYRWGFPLDIPMRVAPTVSFTNCIGWNGNLGTAVTVSTSHSTPNNVDVDLTTSGLTGGTSGHMAKVLTTPVTGFVELTGAEL